MTWNREKWVEFIVINCEDYSRDVLYEDAEFLAQQHLTPSLFHSSIGVLGNSVLSVGSRFERFTIGNMMRLIDACSHYTDQQQGPSIQKPMESPTPPPAKRLRMAPSLAPSCEDFQWFEKVKHLMYYFVRDGDKENFPRRCACAVSPTIAVTYAHGKNRQLKRRVVDQKGKFIESGSVLKLHHLVNLNSLQRQNEHIKAEVVVSDDVTDFILLEALEGNVFYEGDEKENVLENPTIGQKLFAVGLSSRTTSQVAITTGVVLSVDPFEDRQMVSDIITWGGDSGGGLFSHSNKLLGIVSASQASDEGEWTRTFFAPANEIIVAWFEA